MVNNSININKTNNQLSPITIEHKKPTTYRYGKAGTGLRQAMAMAGQNR